MQKEKAVLFGAGAIGLLAYHLLNAENIECFVDNDEKKDGSFLCGKEIISFEKLRERYANRAGYRIYLTSTRYSSEIAKQLIGEGIFNFSYFFDFIPKVPELIRLFEEYGIKSGDKIALVGTSNCAEVTLEALNSMSLPCPPSAIYAPVESGAFIGHEFIGVPVFDLDNLKRDISDFDYIIFCLHIDMVFRSDEERAFYERSGVKYIFANEAVKYITAEYNERQTTLKKLDPHQIFNSKRMDVAVRYLLFRDIANNIENRAHISLYARSILSSCGGDERVGVYTQRIKRGVSEYIESAKKLYQSMSENGFNAENYIPVSGDRICNGAHRLAAALTLDQDVWVHYTDAAIQEKRFDWFCENGFNNEDKIRILRAFADIYFPCGIFMVFAPVFDNLDYIRAQISSKMNIVGEVELDFSCNYFAFENLIKEIYLSHNNAKPWIDGKIRLLKLSPLKIKVILVNDEGNTQENLYANMTHMKLMVRDSLTFEVDSESFCLLHGSDRRPEFILLKNTVLSVNNLKHYKMMINLKYRKEFINALDRFKDFCLAESIDIDETCILGGSVLEVMGIRESKGEVDFTVLGKYRTKYGNQLRTLADSIDIRPLNSIQIGDGEFLDDNVLICDENYHFMFYGCKFANLELVRLQKKNDPRNRKKDLQDVRLIEMFQDFAAFFDEKEVLREQIAKELAWRKSLQ